MGILKTGISAKILCPENTSWLNYGDSNYSQYISLPGGFNEVYMSGELLRGSRNLQEFFGPEKQSIRSWKTAALGPRE